MSVSGAAGRASGLNHKFGIRWRKFAVANSARRMTFALTWPHANRRTVRWRRRFGFSFSTISAYRRQKKGTGASDTARACSCSNKVSGGVRVGARRMSRTSRVRVDQAAVRSARGLIRCREEADTRAKILADSSSSISANQPLKTVTGTTRVCSWANVRQN